MGTINKQYKKVICFIGKDLRWTLAATVVSFVLLVILTDLFFMKNPELMRDILRSFAEKFDEIAADGNISALKLLQNNFLACVSSVAYGFVPFLFLPALALAGNAAGIGAIGALYGTTGKSVIHMYLFGILPHGIFELPAIFLSIAMGIHLCKCITKRICGKSKGVVKSALADIVRTIICLVLPLLIVAAIVEAYITPVLLENFLV